MSYTLSAPRKSGYEQTFDTLPEVREAAAGVLDTTTSSMIEVDGSSTATTYCYVSQEEADADQDGAYAVKYWLNTEDEN